MSGRFARTVVTALALSALLGATCENQDISGRFSLTLEPGEGAVTQTFSLPYIGRGAIDYGLSNTGDTAAFTVRAQAQTSGDPTASGCEDGESGTPRRLTAVPVSDGVIAEDAAPPTMQTQGRSHIVTLPSGASIGAILLRARTSGRYRIFTSGDADTLSLADDDGVAIPFDTVVETATCATFANAVSAELTDGTYVLTVREDQPTLLFERDCADVRPVPRTCPGEVSEVFEVGPFEVDAGGFRSGRVDVIDFGIGDEAVVELSCDDAASGCAGELEVFFALQPLECRQNADCRPLEDCNVSGYCERVRERGCAASPATSPPLFGAAIALLLLWTSRRR